MFCRSRTGFTLIELLIVVAIIAILAAIAVPNFLEAQTRSKIARIKADLRSMSTAQEAYYIEWNSYTWRNNADENPARNGVWGGFLQLTTPVAYITSIPTDPFGQTRFQGAWRPAFWEMGTGVANVAASGAAPWVGGGASAGMPSNTWEIESDGPDHVDDTYDPISTGSYPWPSLADNDANVALMLALRYDPTNGTVSTGEIWRCGGVKPNGRPLDCFYQGGVN